MSSFANENSNNLILNNDCHINNTNQFEKVQNTYSVTFIRNALQIVRDPNKTAYDRLPSGETIAAFANRYANERYKTKLESKRYRMKRKRQQKRIEGILFQNCEPVFKKRKKTKHA
jgi:hypothetical protein